MGTFDYLDKAGATYLVGKIKDVAKSKVDKVDGKGLSTNDYTTDEKNKLAGLENYTLPTASDSIKGGVKVGTGLQMNGDVLSVSALGGVTTVNGKSGDVTLSAGDVGAYTKSEVDAKTSSVYRVKGSVATVEALPSTGNVIGDVYNVISTGMNYVWSDNETWDALGSIVDLEPYVLKTDMVPISNSEIDAMWN